MPGSGSSSAGVLESPRNALTRDLVAQVLRGTAHSRLKHSPILSKKRQTCLSWSFGLRERFQVWHISGAYRSAFRECRPEDVVFALSLCVTACGVSQKGANKLVWCYNFHNCHAGNTSRLPGSDGWWVSCLWSHWTVFICIL